MNFSSQGHQLMPHKLDNTETLLLQPSKNSKVVKLGGEVEAGKYLGCLSVVA